MITQKEVDTGPLLTTSINSVIMSEVKWFINKKIKLVFVEQLIHHREN